jgi:AmmeMemoRadiSam system protein B
VGVASVRPPAVAGQFYPGSPIELKTMIDHMLGEVAPPEGPCPKALIVPHAGYIYSGPIAASAFARVKPYGKQITRVVLVGPAHRVFVEGLAGPGASKLATPLGELVVDEDALRSLGVPANAAAHAREHSLEVELPFLQRVCPSASIVPMCGSRAAPEAVGRILESLWGGPETLIVISSDLSHYHPYVQGRTIDKLTCKAIVARESSIVGDQACGSIGINGLMWVARKRNLRVELVDLRSSGDTAGKKDEVVGYGAFALYEEAA